MLADGGGACSLAGYLFIPAVFAVCLVALLAIGLALTFVLWHGGWRVRPALLPMLVIGCSSALGYGFFWLFLANPTIGKYTTILIVVAAAYVLVARRTTVVDIWRLPDLWIPLILMLLVGLFLTSITYVGIEEGAVCPLYDPSFVLRRLILAGSPDYLIQKIWMDRLWAGTPSPWNTVLEEVSLSTLADRPPLLAGIALMFKKFTGGYAPQGYFMAMSSAASLAWVPAIWGLARTAGLTLARSSALIATLAFVYFFWFATIFSWPKMLSGALCVGSVLFIFNNHKGESQSQSQSVILGAGFAGLSFLAHFSSAMCLVGMVPLLVMPKRWPGVRRTLIGMCVFLAIALPYLALKSAHEGSSSVSKYMLTGNFIQSIPADEFKALSTIDAIRRAYSALTWPEIVQNRLNNAAKLFTAPCLFQCAGKSVKHSRDFEQVPILASLKLFNLGWLIVIPLLLIGRKRMGLSPPWNQVRTVSGECISVALFGLLVFLLIAFSHVNNSATSGFALLLVSAAGIAIFSLPAKVVGLFSLLVMANFCWFTVRIFRDDNLILVYPLLALAVLAIVGLGTLIRASNFIDSNLAQKFRH